MNGALAQTTTLVSLDSGGAQGDGDTLYVSISADGRYVAFMSHATNLVPGDTNGTEDVFVRDRQANTTERVSVDSSGAQANGSSGQCSISADGRYVAFQSSASNLVPGDTNNAGDIFVRDLLTGMTERVTVDSGGAQANDFSYSPSISADGRYVTFTSHAWNLVPGDTNVNYDVFVRDRQTGTTERVSVDSNGAQANGYSVISVISADGRYVTFISGASNLVPGDTNGTYDIFVRDRQSATTERVSVSTNGFEANLGSEFPSLSADGRYVVFLSYATNLVAGDTNGYEDVFVRDRQAATTERVSVDSGGVQGNRGNYDPSVSDDGRYVAFHSDATNLVPGDTNGVQDVFVRDRWLGTTERVSLDSSGAQGNAESWSFSGSIRADGRYVVFGSSASNLVPGDSNGHDDAFVRDRGAPSAYTPFCYGDGSGIQCPCNNSGVSGHGCDNSSATGGALLVATGNPLLSGDTLLLTSSGERQTGFSVFWQGDREVSPRAFGDGVGCLGGHLKRLFFHNAVGGIVAAPQGSDASVSARSAAVGDPISPGTIRVYHVFYRDADPSFCPPPTGATFNSTNGLRVLWGA